jgi:NAD(P)H dehydrogenase (quinone)
MAKITLVFDTDTGKNEELALLSEKVIKNLGAEIRIRKVPPICAANEQKKTLLSNEISFVSSEDMEWAQGYILSCPVHSGTFSAAMKYFLDQIHWKAAAGAFLNRPLTAMTTGKMQHAGVETTIQQLYSIVQEWGSLIVSSSFIYNEINSICGNPYGLSFILDDKGSLGDSKKVELALQTHFKRFINIIDASSQIQNHNLSKNIEPDAYTIAKILADS